MNKRYIVGIGIIVICGVVGFTAFRGSLTPYVSFAEARQLGVPILPGSDPLPFMGQERRIGSFGFVADTALALARPAEGLRRWLQAHRVQPPVYGEGETFGRFWVNQLRMQWRKRVSRAG